MKIDIYKNKGLSKENLPIFEQILAKGYSAEEVFEADYSVFFSKSFDKEAFLRLCSLTRKVLRNSKCRKDFVFALKLAYRLIDMGEKYLVDNDDYVIENATAVLYEKLGFILFSDDTFDFVPGFSIRFQYKIEPDNKLAKVYFERAIILDPNSTNSCFALGLYYLRLENYHKAFAYLIKTDITDFDDVPGYAALFTELGCYFDEEFKGSLVFFDSNEKAFRSFERAYYTFKNEPRDEEVIYNMAYAYLEGVGVMRNKRKGMSLLKELDERLKADGKDITKENDPDGIIKKYYN